MAINCHQHGLNYADECPHCAAVEAVTDYSPFPGCPRIIERFQQLVGLYIVHGWTRQVKDLFAGVQGCTHLTELLAPIATTAFQVIITHKTGDGMKHTDTQKPGHLNSCHMLAEDSEIVAERWPQFYRATIAH